MELPNLNSKEPKQILKWINPIVKDTEDIERYLINESAKLIAYELATNDRIEFELN